jgi:hypothetical protein
MDEDSALGDYRLASFEEIEAAQSELRAGHAVARDARAKRRAKMASFIERGGAKPPLLPLIPRSTRRSVEREGVEQRAIADAWALFAMAKDLKGPVLIYPRHLEILVSLAHDAIDPKEPDDE